MEKFGGFNENSAEQPSIKESWDRWETLSEDNWAGHVVLAESLYPQLVDTGDDRAEQVKGFLGFILQQSSSGEYSEAETNIERCKKIREIIAYKDTQD